MILGIDEVGRGPWAGPLVVGAVALNDATIEGLADSKLLTATRREALYHEIVASNATIGLGWVHANEIDTIGLSQSLIEATKRAVAQIKTPYHEIIIDGTVNFLAGTPKGTFVTTLKKADMLIASVSAASIVAKVARDEYMKQQATLYPHYGFETHVGYGTAKHRAAIAKYGVTTQHRRSFAPLKDYSVDQNNIIDHPKMTTKNIGDSGEGVAAEWLTRQGYTIAARNWKTKLCEIDIVATKKNVYFFVEVKHRKNINAGGGIAAITSKKYRQMLFAAKLYMHFEQLSCDAQLAVITTTRSADGTTIFESYVEVE